MRLGDGQEVRAPVDLSRAGEDHFDRRVVVAARLSSDNCARQLISRSVYGSRMLSI